MVKLLLGKSPLPHKMQKITVFSVAGGVDADRYLYIKGSYIIVVARVFSLNNLKKLSRISECMLLFQKVKKTHE